MNKELSKKEIENALSHFQIKGEVKSCEHYGSGHINDTFLIKAERDYILQRMNTNIFKNAKELWPNEETYTADGPHSDVRVKHSL